MNLKRFFSKSLTALLCFSFFLSSCGGAAASSSRPVVTPMPSAASKPEPILEDKPIALTAVAGALAGGYSGDEEGAYTLSTHEDNSLDILYINYHGRAMNMLDAPQRTGESRGHIDEMYGVATPVLAGDFLYIFSMGVTYTPGVEAPLHAPKIIRLNTDGTNPETLELPEGHAFSAASAILWDAASFYCITTTYSGDVPENHLIKIDFSKQEATVLHSFEAGPQYSIVGSYDMGPTLREASPLPATNDPAYNDAWLNREYRLFNLGLLSGEQHTLLTYTQTEMQVVTNGKMTYTFNNTDSTISALDADTGVQTVIASDFAPEGYMEAALYYSGDQLTMQFADKSGSLRGISHIVINPATGEVASSNVNNLGRNVFILAQTQDYFLVWYDDRWVSVVENVPGGVAQRENVTVPVLALISKTDYWAGAPNYIEIQDNVY